jgi:predicted nucleic acid-binding protein
VRTTVTLDEDVRLLLNREIRRSGLSFKVKKWLSRPNCEVLYPATGHVERAIALVTQSGGGGNLSTDAQIAALALEHLATVHTADLDFQRFQGLRWYSPITGGKSS